MPKDAHPGLSSVLSPERLHDHALASLLPFFLDGAASDKSAARAVAEGLLEEYHAATPKELQLSAQIVALTWASLACLSAAMVVRDQSLEEMLTLQDCAISLDRSSQKATKALEARRKDRAKRPQAMTSASLQWDEGAFQLAINQALEKLTLANRRRAACTAPGGTIGPGSKPPLSSIEPITPFVLNRRRRH